MSSEISKLTSDEYRALQGRWNLADAHTHQTPSEAEHAAIFGRLTEFAHQARGQMQSESDLKAFVAFHRLLNQSSILGHARALPCYSSSMAAEVVANYLGRNWKACYLTEPTFDNIADILRRCGCELSPIPDHGSGDLPSVLATIFRRNGASPVFIVNPNNPTGSFLNQQELAEVASICHRANVPLVVDACFRVFDERACYDTYAILIDSKCDYVVIEDSGKIWPTMDLKVAYLNVSSSIEEEIMDIYDDFLLNISSFINSLVTAYSEFSRADGLRSVRNLIAENRQTLRSKLNGLSGLRIDSQTAESRVSVEWLHILTGQDPDQLTQSLAANFDVQILSGNKFFWSDPRGHSYLRVALARDSDFFEHASTRMALALSSLLRL